MSPSAFSAPPVPCLVGPTASGKSEVALWCARASNAEVIACDAFGVYRGLRLLSAAPTAPADVPHHLVGVLSPSEAYSAARFVADADAAVADITARGRRPWIVGGTALYLRSWLKGLGAGVERDEALRQTLVERARREGSRALHADLERLDPVRAAQVHPHDERRLVRALEIVAVSGRPASAVRSEWTGPDRVPARLVGLRRQPEDLDARIARRTAQLFAAGVVEEARAFLAAGPSPEARMALGLDDLAEVLAGRRSAAEAEQTLAQGTRRLARRQMTFFRSFPEVVWLDVGADEPAHETAARVQAALDPQGCGA